MKQKSGRKSHHSTKTGGKPRKSPTDKSLSVDTPSKSTDASLPAILTNKDTKEAIKTAIDATKEGGVDTGVIEETAEKQWWYRKPDSKSRELAKKIATLDALDLKDEEIAKKLKTTAGTVKVTRFLARKNGWWDKEDQPIDLEEEMALSVERKVVRNINAALDGKMTNWQTHEMTIAAAKGRGIFKSHDKVEANVTGLPNVVAIQIVMPPIGEADQRVEISDANVGGVPAYLEGEVEDGEPVGEQRRLPATAGEGTPQAEN